MSAKDHGPAFPRSASTYTNEQDGMSLRDWFAGQVIGHIIACEEVAQVSISKDAELAYKIADAMLEERSKE